MRRPARARSRTKSQPGSVAPQLHFWRPFLLLAAILTLVTFASTGAAIAILFRASLRETSQRLQAFTQSYARLIEELAAHEERFSHLFPAGSGHGAPLEATLEQLRAAQSRAARPGRSAELVVAQAVGDSILFLLSHSPAGISHVTRLPRDGRLAQPTLRALAGQSGTMVGLDYRGVRVVAAFEPARVFGGLGIVAKVDMAEVQAPFLRAGLLTVCVALILTVPSALLFFCITSPMVRRLAESERRYRATFEQTAVGIAHVSPEGRFLLANQRFCEIAGRTPEELLITSIQEITHPADRDTNAENLRRMLAGEIDTCYTEQRSLRKDGSPAWVCLSMSLVRELRNRPLYLIMVVEDISARRLAEDERARLARQLQQKNVELEQLIYAASHDLRSPLVGVEGFIGELKRAVAELLALLHRPETPPELARDAAPLEADITESLRYIDAGTRRMSNLQSGLLRLSRLGRADPQIESLDMNRLLARILASAEFASRAADARIEVEDLPPCMGDSSQVEQVFANLLDNAIKYRDPVRPLVIRFTGTSDGTMATYCVSDNGLGISPELRQRVFQPFYRIDAHRVPGEGIGLTIVARILSRLGGSISIESEPGGGSRFCVTLPAEEHKPGKPS
ncbi:MAG: PAS domain S-box protein [candidate division WOR-3 bacterium]